MVQNTGGAAINPLTQINSITPSSVFDVVVATLNRLVSSSIELLFNMIIAITLVVLGWFVGSAVGDIVKRLLNFFKLEAFIAQHKLEDALGNVKVTNVLVQLAKYYVILVFVNTAVSFLTLGPLSTFLTNILQYAPKVIGSVIVVVAAAVIGELLRQKVLEVHEKEDYMRLLGNAAKYITVFMGVVVSLDTLGFQTIIITSTFVALVQAVGFAFALAIGLAFGFGGQDAAREWIKEWRKRIHF